MITRSLRASGAIALALSVSHCAMFSGPNMEGYVRKVPVTSIAAPLLPAGGKQLIIIGQHADSADHEPGDLGPPGGVMMYTTLGPGKAALIAQDLQPGSGSAPARYPQSAIQIGLYVVNRLEDILKGAQDEYIDELIRVLAQSGRPIYLRFGYEFDGEWNHYSPVEYRSAWRYFRQRMVAAGATNIAMVWHSAANCGGTYQGQLVEQWYAGDDQVDWIGISWFAGESCNYSRARYLVDFARLHHKPLMIAESTPKGYDLASLQFSWNGRRFDSRSAGSIWSGWFEPYFDFIKTNADVVRAVCYINDNWQAGAQPPRIFWGNSQLDANPSIARRWRSEMNDRRWLRGGPDLMRELSVR